MDQQTKRWVAAAKNAVNSLQEKFRLNKGMLLTEGDLECHLLNELMLQPGLGGYHDSKNGTKHIRNRGEDFKTGFIHSQVTWFKENQQSGFEVDLTISDPGKLEVMSIEIFEEYPSKGFAYDGECVGIELKFIRQPERTSTLAHEDFLKLRDKLIPAKLTNITTGKYKISTKDNVAFITVVGCKSKDIFDAAKSYLGKHLADKSKPCPENLYVCLFFQEDIIWDKAKFIEAYEQKKPEIENRKRENELLNNEYLAETRKRKEEEKVKKSQ